jgi:hypothetical protein
MKRMRVKGKLIVLGLILSAVIMLSLVASSQAIPGWSFSFPSFSLNGSLSGFEVAPIADNWQLSFPGFTVPTVTPTYTIAGSVASSKLVLMIANPPSTGQIYNMPMMPASSVYYTVEVMQSQDPAIAEGTYATLILNFNPGQPPSNMVAKAPAELVTGAVLGINEYTYDSSYRPYAKIEVDIPIGTDWTTKVSVLSSPAT